MKFRSKVGAGALALGVVSSISLLAFSSCQTKDASRLRETAAVGGAVDPATLAANARGALDAHCGSCHGPQAPEALGAIGYITDLQKLVDKKKVKRGTPEEQKKSRIYVRLFDTESPMPPLATESGTPIERMPQEAIQAIEAWVLADSPIGGAAPVQPAPMAAPAVPEEAAPADNGGLSLAAAARGALDRACGSCHGPQAPEALGAIGYINDLQKLVDKKKVKRGTPDEQRKSRVLVRMKDAESPMPPAADEAGNPVTPMTPADAAAIEAWIMADSPVTP